MEKWIVEVILGSLEIESYSACGAGMREGTQGRTCIYIGEEVQLILIQ